MRRNQQIIYVAIFIVFILAYFFIIRSKNISKKDLRVYKTKLDLKVENKFNNSPYRFFESKKRNEVIYLFEGNNKLYGKFFSNNHLDSIANPLPSKPNTQWWYFNETNKFVVGLDAINQEFYFKENGSVVTSQKIPNYFIMSASFLDNNSVIFFAEKNENSKPYFIVFDLIQKKLVKEIDIFYELNYKVPVNNKSGINLLFEGAFINNTNNSIYYYSFRHSIVYEVVDGHTIKEYKLIDKIEIPFEKTKTGKINLNNQETNISTDNLNWYNYDAQIVGDTLYVLSSKKHKNNYILDIYTVNDFNYHYSKELMSNSPITYLIKLKEKLLFFNDAKEILQ